MRQTEVFNVTFSAYTNEDMSENRLDRLLQWMSWYAFKIGLPIHSIHVQIEDLHDHEGGLMVTFTHKPSQLMMDIALAAWVKLEESCIEFQYIQPVNQIIKVED
jgi:hypothetical protein